MSLKLKLGSAGDVEVAASGDLAKYLKPGVDSLIRFSAAVEGMLERRIADAPSGSLSTNFQFTNIAPSWNIPGVGGQTVGITLSVKPAATCTLTILKPGDTLFTYMTGEDGKETPVKAPADTYYISLGLSCSVAVDAGAKWSSGSFGLSGNISTTDQFKVANYYAVPGFTRLGAAVEQAFANFVLPFHAASIQRLPAGDYVDFEFIGKLALGFGATYGFSGTFLGGQSKGEVTKSFSTPMGKAVVSAAPSYQVGAAFKLQYSHNDAFRVVAGRTASGATLYLLRKHASGFNTIGITLSAGAKFHVDASTVKAEAQTALQKAFPGDPGSLLGTKLGSVVDQAVGDVNDSVNQLLQMGDGQKIALEAAQSSTHENTALFIYDFDFSQGVDAYGVAMRGDYATALTMPGVALDTRSFIEQVYTKSAGLSLQFFSLLRFQDVTQYIRKTQFTYLGNRVFQIREIAGVKGISGLFGKEREADLYLIQECRNVMQSPGVSDVRVRLNAVFTDRNNAAAFDESYRMLKALALASAAKALRSYVTGKPKGTVQFTLDIDVTALAAIDSDAYLQDDKPAPEPHRKDNANYDAFVRAIATVVGDGDPVAGAFLQSFGTYGDWLNYNRVTTDEQGSTNPGDRLHEGNTNVERWPAGYAPSDRAKRSMVQTYILAAQAYMNFCDSLKWLISDLPTVDTEKKFEEMYEAVAAMIRNEGAFPTYFLKPSMVALTQQAGVNLAVSGTTPDPGVDTFALTLEPAALAARAVS
jgi:hypothetical protein